MDIGSPRSTLMMEVSMKIRRIIQSAFLAFAVVLGAAYAASTTLTATGLRIGDHPAFVRAVVDFSGTVAGGNGAVIATDVLPLDGRAALQLVLPPGARTVAGPKSAFGIAASVAHNTRGLRIDLRSVRGQFKYLSWAWVQGHHLAIDLWKSAPPSVAATIRVGARGCLTLDTVRVDRSGVVRAAGRERNVFEHQLMVVVRGANGRTLASRSVTARAGRWSARLAPASAHRQVATLEAVVDSAADGSLSCIVQQRITLP
jgi:hypothetical protein